MLYFKAPYSFTGEDVVEFQCHGGTIVASTILRAILEAGGRLAEPGEFTKRAVLSGKMDLTKAEAIASLIEAKSEDAAKILARQMKGSLREYVDRLRETLVEILAYTEVTIDYAEEDLPTDLQEQIQAKLAKIRAELNHTLQISKSREGLIDGFRIAIVGKPNVGKSSLLNALLHYNRAITSDIAGTTRDTIEESLKIGTHLVRIIDTAGIREGTEEIERIGIERSIAAMEEGDIILALFDASQPLDHDDRRILSLLTRYQEKKEIVVLVNKKDLPQRIDLTPLEHFDPLMISAKTDSSLVIERVKQILDAQRLDDELILINQRQILHVTRAKEAIERAETLIQTQELELFAYELNEAITHMAALTHPFERDEILEKMFGSFCLGK